jgi:hypothetical protein
MSTPVGLGRFQLIFGIPKTTSERDRGGQNGKSSGLERINRQVKETMASAYGTKLYDPALGLGALDQGNWQVGE